MKTDKSSLTKTVIAWLCLCLSAFGATTLPVNNVPAGSIVTGDFLLGMTAAGVAKKISVADFTAGFMPTLNANGTNATFYSGNTTVTATNKVPYWLGLSDVSKTLYIPLTNGNFPLLTFDHKSSGEWVGYLGDEGTPFGNPVHMGAWTFRLDDDSVTGLTGPVERRWTLATLSGGEEVTTWTFLTNSLNYRYNPDTGISNRYIFLASRTNVVKYGHPDNTNNFQGQRIGLFGSNGVFVLNNVPLYGLGLGSAALEMIKVDASGDDNVVVNPEGRATTVIINGQSLQVTNIPADSIVRVDGNHIAAKVTIGSGLSFSGGTLSASGGGGGVSSVAITAPAGVTVSGSPITTSGTIALSTPSPIITNGSVISIVHSNNLRVDATHVLAANGDFAVGGISTFNGNTTNSASSFYANNTPVYGKRSGAGYVPMIAIDSSGDDNIAVGTNGVAIILKGSLIQAASLAGTGTAPIQADSSGNLSRNATKVYRALLSQTGTAAPSATVLENSLGGTVVWTRTSFGAYLGTLSTAFPAGKTFLNISNYQHPGEQGRIACGRNDNNSVFVVTGDGADSLDDIITPVPGEVASLEIFVYP